MSTGLNAAESVGIETGTTYEAIKVFVAYGEVTLPDGTVIDGSGIGVAVVDSGVDGTHPDLESRMGGNVKIVCSAPMPGATQFNPFEECRGPKTAVPMPDTDTPSAGGHGTHVAGIVAGDGTASGGRYHGAAPGATLYGVSVGTFLTVENGVTVVFAAGNSFGSGFRPTTTARMSQPDARHRVRS